MKILGYDTHPAADLFPLMDGQEFEEFRKDVEKNGLIHPIILHEGRILDGRNRARACTELGLAPRVEHWHGDSPTAYVIALNLRRRHLSQSQRALVAAEALPMFEKEAKERQREHGQTAPGRKTLSAPVREVFGKAAERAAASTGVGSRYVEAAKALTEKAPELVEQVRSGALTLKQAEKQIRRTAQIEAVRVYQPPTGLYPVIVADPPWQYEDTLEGSDAARGGLTYPPMSLDEICALKVPADKDCVLWLWVTNAHLIDGSAARVLEAWGFDGKTLLTWDKERMGLGRWLRGVTEHCILATRGKPWVSLSNQTTIIRESRREHSRKPEAFYALVEKLCPARPLLEMFARTERDGWATSGSEVGVFGAA